MPIPNLAFPISGPLAFMRHPVRYGWFEDGIVVTAADTSLAYLVGQRALQIGSLPLDATFAILDDHGYRENAMTTRLSTPLLLRLPELLHRWRLWLTPTRRLSGS